MKKRLMKFAATFAVCSSALLGSGCARNVDYVKERSAQTAQASGWEIIGYEGYQWCPFYGGKVWYLMRRSSEDVIIYNAAFCKRPGTEEIHIANLNAVNAIQP